MAVEDLEIRPGLVIPGSEIGQQASRASGPGGQHVNKTSTRITLRWNVVRSRALEEALRQRLLSRLHAVLTQAGDLVVHADRERSQARNLEAARRRLAELVGEAAKVERPRRPTRPTRASQRRRQETKKKQSSLKRTRGPVGEGDD